MERCLMTIRPSCFGMWYRYLAPCLALMTLTDSSAQASTIASGRITAVYISGSKGLVDATGSHTAPACAGSSQWAFDLTTASGQAKYATALTAYSLKANVLITGTGSCPDWGDRETIDEIGVTQ